MPPSKSLLERIIQELPHSRHPSPFPLERNPFQEGPWFSIGRRAVEILAEKEEIKSFMSAYVQHIQDKFKLSPGEAERSARSAVGYCTGYVGDDQANKWFTALPDIAHPIMGRERPFKGGDNIHLYFLVAESTDQEIRKYLKRELRQELSELGFQVSEVSYQNRTKGKTPYLSFAIRPSEAPVFGTVGTFMFLTGWVRGIRSRLQEDLGKSCQLYLETVGEQDAKA